MTDQTPPAVAAPGRRSKGCGTVLAVVAVLLVIGGAMSLWDWAFGSHDKWIPDSEAIERVDGAYVDCLTAVGLDTSTAVVHHVPEPNPRGRYLSRVVLEDGAEFTVNALDDGAIAANDQANDDLDAAGC